MPRPLWTHLRRCQSLEVLGALSLLPNVCAQTCSQDVGSVIGSVLSLQFLKCKETHLLSTRGPLLILTIILYPFEKHISPPLSRSITRLYHRIWLIRALRNCLLLI